MVGTSTDGSTSLRAKQGLDDWSVPELAFRRNGAGEPEFARFGSLRRIGPDLVLAGSNVQSLLVRSRYKDVLVIGMLGDAGRPITRPTGSFAFLFPKIAPRPSGGLTMVWGESAEADTSPELIDWNAVRVDALWSAHFSPVNGWSIPEKIFDGPVIWEKFAVGEIAARQNELALAVPLASNKQHTLVGLVLLRFNGSHWRASTIELQVNPVVANIALSDTHLIIAFLAAATGPDSDVNSIWTLRDTFSGDFTVPPLLVVQSGRNPANFVQVFADNVGDFHLVWHRNFEGSSSLLMHARFNRGADAWSNPSKLPVSGDLNCAVSIMDERNRIHIVFQNYPNFDPNGFLDHVVWSEGWQTQQHLFPSLRAIDAALSTDGPTGVALTMLAQPKSYAAGAAYQLMVSKFRR